MVPMLSWLVANDQSSNYDWNLFGSARVELSIQPIDYGLKRRRSSRTLLVTHLLDASL
jgi:hypothetical protein